MKNPPAPTRIIRIPEAKRLVGVSRTTLYTWMRAGQFPAAVRIGPRAVGWRESDITDWMHSRDRVGGAA